jgi:hypothetical protein
MSCGGGGGKIQFRQHDRPLGLILSPKSCGQESAKRALQKEIDGEIIGGQGIEKSFQMEVCLPVQRTHTGVVHVCKHTFQTVSGAVHHSLKGLCSVRQPKWNEQIFKQDKWSDNRRFWDVSGCNRYLVITLDKANF